MCVFMMDYGKYVSEKSGYAQLSKSNNSTRVARNVSRSPKREKKQKNM